MGKKKQHRPSDNPATTSTSTQSDSLSAPSSSSKGKSKTNPSSPIACIIPNLLYLSPVSVTGNAILLEREKITHIISIGRNPFEQIDGITYHRLGLKDEEDADLKPTVERVCEIIDEVAPSALMTEEENAHNEEHDMDNFEFDTKGKAKDGHQKKNNGGKPSKRVKGEDTRVLIHCSAAISRSPAIIAGYLMRRRRMTLRDSLKTLVQARGSVSPNQGFLRQLCEMERDVFGLGEDEEGSFDMSQVKGKLATYLLRD